MVQQRITHSTLFFISMFLLLIPGCAPDEEEDRPDVEREEVRAEVVFGIADDRPLNVYIYSQGIVEANRELMIRPRVSGYVESSMLEEGRYVEEGDTLLAFVDEEFRYDLRSAENEFEMAEIEYQIEYEPRENRVAEGEISDPAMLRLWSGLAQAEQNLERARLNFSYSVIRAPFSGYLSVPDRVTPGAFVGSSTELGTLIADESVRIHLDVLESELNQLEAGMPVRITSPAGVYMEGELIAVAPVVDSESKTGRVVAEIENLNRELKTGMTVEGRILARSYTGMARIPREAVLDRDGGRLLIFKLNGDHVEWVYVNPEQMTPEYAIVNSEDIAPGDTVAVDRHFALSHLQVVRPRMAGEIVEEEVPIEN
ncbi:MAG: efflux RND transporter periplasmic adaptor subunit [Balneolaceae bacterium]